MGATELSPIKVCMMLGDEGDRQDVQRCSRTEREDYVSLSPSNPRGKLRDSSSWSSLCFKASSRE